MKFVLFLLPILFISAFPGQIQLLRGIHFSRFVSPEVYAFSKPEDSALADKKSSFNEIKKLIGPNDAVLLADPAGRVLFAQNADKDLIPASTIKIFTSLMALHYLGDDYRFETEFYLDTNLNLKIKGYGDPLLISEVLQEISTSLSCHLKQFNDLILDHSYFSDPLTIPGVTSSSEPYDSPNGALCVNFNTVYFKQDKNGNLTSAESQTPLLPYVLTKIKRSGLKQGRILLSNEGNECTIYAGHLFLHFLAGQNIKSSGKIRIGAVDKKTDTLLFTYRSKFSIEQIISRLFEYSNNYIANQLLLSVSAKVFSPPGTLHKGIDVARAYTSHILKDGHISIVEGSGISRGNRLTALSMLNILNEFEPYYYLMQKTGRLFSKTGTLKGVKTRAGYIVDHKKELNRFVILINTPGKTDAAIVKHLIQALK